VNYLSDSIGHGNQEGPGHSIQRVATPRARYMRRPCRETESPTSKTQPAWTSCQGQGTSSALAFTGQGLQCPQAFTSVQAERVRKSGIQPLPQCRSKNFLQVRAHVYRETFSVRSNRTLLSEIRPAAACQRLYYGENLHAHCHLLTQETRLVLINNENEFK
jgi:hypothetical protein